MLIFHTVFDRLKRQKLRGGEMKYHKFRDDKSSAVQDIGCAISIYSEEEALSAMASVAIATLIATHKKEAPAYVASYLMALKRTYELATKQGLPIEHVEVARQ